MQAKLVKLCPFRKVVQVVSMKNKEQEMFNKFSWFLAMNEHLYYFRQLNDSWV